MSPTTQDLLRAAAGGDLNRLRALMANGADINSTNGAGQTALMLAAGFSRRECVNHLLRAGANTEIEDEMGLKAVDWAHNDSEISRLIEVTEVLGTKTVAAEVVARPVSPRLATGTERLADSSPLPGLAGAILRDHKPKTNPVVSIEPEPQVSFVPVEVEPVSEVVFSHDEDEQPPQPESLEEPQPLPIQTDDTVDQTLSGPLKETTEDTLTGIAPRTSRGRIFAIDSSPNLPTQRKVEIAVPARERKRTAGRVIWLLVLVVFVASLFGGYQLLKYLTKSTPVVAPKAEVTSPPAAAPDPTPPALTKTGPVVKGALAGTELHVPDAEYPADSKQSGVVTVQVRASKKGIVQSAKAVDGDDSLREAAEQAARASAFSPDKLENKAAVIDGTITYTFVPGESSTSGPVKNEVKVTTGGPLAKTELNLVRPDYPAKVRAAGITDEVTIVVRVDRAGRPVAWRPLGGDKLLVAESVQAIRRSTFSPRKLPGKGEVVGTVTYSFR